jgi:hypothetical protein
MGLLHMPKELNDLSEHVISHWFPLRKSSHASAGMKTEQMKEAWEGRDPVKWRYDLAWGTLPLTLNYYTNYHLGFIFTPNASKESNPPYVTPKSPMTHNLLMDFLKWL